MALFDTIRAGSSGATDFEIERSLRFNESDTYLSRTPSSDGNRRTWTISIWFKNGSEGLQGQRFWSTSTAPTEGKVRVFAVLMNMADMGDTSANEVARDQA